ncbi:aspartic peptidase domain-containing protein [Chiua virens]|nr:aspartic peptidase domain-containing protein [Chiua virens]
MMPSKGILFLILVTSSAVDATPLTRHSGKAALSFATRIHERGTLNVVEKDRARVQAMKQASHNGKRSASLSATNTDVSYTASVGVGQPPTYYNLLIDTGSSNTWVGAGKSYTQTNTSKNTGDSVSVKYGSGSFSGEEWLDTVALSSELVISQQSIGVASSSTGFSGVDGILGVGPIDLTEGTVTNTGTVSTVTDNLLSQGTISQEVLGIYFVPASEPNNGGELTFGGYDSSVVTSSVNYVPLTTSTPASYYWGIDESISYGGKTILSTTSGVVDTGTTLILIASDAFQTYQSLTGATQDNATGLLSLTSTQYSTLQTLTFNIGSESYGLTPNAQIWPRSLNTAIGGSSSGIYLIISDIGTPSGSGINFINGYTFLERYYSVFDTTNNQIGFASTAYTQATTN